jgi:alpha-aminoadipate carrier protein LysW
MGISMINIDCTDCGGMIDIPEDVLIGEIISCPDCGLDYVVEADESGLLILKELTIEGEDWGE